MTTLRFAAVNSKLLGELNVELEAGCHFVVSAEAATAAELLGLCAGSLRPKRGAIWLGGLPAKTVAKAQLGVLPVEVSLPHGVVGQLVDHVLQASGLKGSAGELLARWNLSHWAVRPTESLDALQARALALLLALAKTDLKLLALHEPFSMGLPQDRVVAELQRCADAGAVVVITSPDDCGPPEPLHAARWLLDRNGLRPEEKTSPAPGALPRPSLLIGCSDPRALAAPITRDARVLSLWFDDAAAPGLLEIRGTSIEALAQALADAALVANIEIRHLSRRTWSTGNRAGTTWTQPDSAPGAGGPR